MSFRLATVFALLATVVFAAPAHAGERYLEIVKEKTACAENKDCFTEYVLLSNGIAIKKQYDTQDYDTAPAMTIRKMAQPETDAVFAQAGGFMTANKTHASDPADRNNLYFYDGKAPESYSAGEPLPEDFTALFGAVAAAFGKAGASDDFYLHEYFAQMTGDTHDFHIFSDGTIIYSVFGKDSYKLLSSIIFNAKDIDLPKVLQLSEAAFAAAPADKRMKCESASGLDFGFLEIESKGRVLHTYTCGQGQDGISTLFRYVRWLQR